MEGSRPFKSVLAQYGFSPHPHETASVVEAVAQFDVDFARVVVVKAAEGDAVVDEQAAIGDVQRIH